MTRCGLTQTKLDTAVTPARATELGNHRACYKMSCPVTLQYSELFRVSTCLSARNVS
jgi:hypothetical protein